MVLRARFTVFLCIFAANTLFVFAADACCEFGNPNVAPTVAGGNNAPGSHEPEKTPPCCALACHCVSCQTFILSPTAIALPKGIYLQDVMSKLAYSDHVVSSDFQSQIFRPPIV